ncbi:hypothetical protein [Mycobacterium shigaense]|uniref:hypothetical protein n=1 Tax=Mycobacterium shigaense TaxID=722731 RepID=UPI002AE08764|nr:hypothetical protein [Mycobacterium shigaense]MEA1120648.1 hypothetical protein [Mycobacterium shigaense]
MPDVALDGVLLVLRDGRPGQGDGVCADREIEVGDRRAVLEKRSGVREIERVDSGIELDLIDDVDARGQRPPAAS